MSPPDNAPETAFEGSIRYTVVVTSCGRFDLLQESLDSLTPYLDPKPEEILIIEDSGDAGVREAIVPQGVPLRFIVNEVQLGQMKAIDRAYGEVKTPFVFHTEDDWKFFRPGFIAQSLRVLEARSDVSMVCLRPREELNPLIRDAPMETIGGVECFLQDPAKHPEYFSYSFNPGLRRMADYATLGPFAALGHEADVSYTFKRAGFRIASLQDPAVRHIGDGRHVEDPTMPRKARTPLEKLARSVRKRVKRVRRFLAGNA